MNGIYPVGAAQRKLLSWAALAVALILFVAVNLFSNAALTTSRLDLTENGLYTLTPGTRNILAGLEEPITLRFFLSREQAAQLPGINSYAQRVQELLREYKRRAGGRITLHIIDPEPFSEDEDRAVGYGLSSVPLGDGAEQFYFGLVGANSTDQQEIIPFFSPSREEFLEYDVTRMIHLLADTDQQVVGLMSTLPLDGGAPGPGGGLAPPWVIFEQMQQLFEVRNIPTDAAQIPDDVDVLMLVHPKDLGAGTLYAIDQYVLGGGHLLLFVDPNSDADRPPGMMGMGGAPGSSSLETLFSAWGIDLAAGKVAADLRVAERVRFQAERGQAVAEYPVWMNTAPEQANPDDVVTANLGNLFFATAGVITPLETQGVEVTPLVRTTADAMQVDAAQLRFMTDPTILLRQYRPGGEPLMLAARISGTVRTAFPEGAPPADTEAGADAGAAAPADPAAADPGVPGPHVAEAVDPVNMIVVADTDFLVDDYWVQTQNFLGSRLFVPTAANGDFVINALESLAGSDDLISVRSRGRFTRPFDRVAEIQQAAELEFRQKEQELLERLRETEDQLISLEQGKAQGEELILSPAQQEQIDRFRQQKIRIRKELRQVRLQLRKDIERLESWIKFVNVGFMPILVGVFGVVLGIRRRGGRRRGGAPATGAEA